MPERDPRRPTPAAPLSADLSAEERVEYLLRWANHLERKVARLEAERDALRTTLEQINTIRNSIIGHQTINWSEHIYPLVAVLNAAGCQGMAYPEAMAYFGPVTERAAKAEAERDALRADRAATSAALECTRVVVDAARAFAAWDGRRWLRVGLPLWQGLKAAVAALGAPASPGGGDA